MKADFEKGTKVCSRCKRELPVSEFNKDKSKNDGLNYYCRKCITERDKEYYNKRRKAIKEKKEIKHATHLEGLVVKGETLEL